MYFSPLRAWAVIVPAGPYSFDGNLPGNGFVSFSGSSFSTNAVSSTNFGVMINPGSLLQNYSGSNFFIDSGFALSSAYVLDVNANSSVDPGEPIFATIGGPTSTFHISDGAGIILSGSFTSATFTSAEGASAGSLSASTINGLVLTPGPAFTFDTSFVSSILSTPTGFTLSLSSIPGAGGVAATATGPELGSFIPVSIATFGGSTGSVDVSGKVAVVPEPATVVLAALGVSALLGVGWKRRFR